MLHDGEHLPCNALTAPRLNLVDGASLRSYNFELTSCRNISFCITMATGYVSLFSDKRNDFDSIDIRKQTYLFYPQSETPTWAYIDAGFYFTGEKDISRCFRCGLEINKLRLGEDPFLIHSFRRPNCLYVKERLAEETRHLDESDENEFETDSDEESVSEGGGGIREEAVSNISGGIGIIFIYLNLQAKKKYIDNYEYFNCYCCCCRQTGIENGKHSIENGNDVSNM